MKDVDKHTAHSKLTLSFTWCQVDGKGMGGDISPYKIKINTSKTKTDLTIWGSHPSKRLTLTKYCLDLGSPRSNTTTNNDSRTQLMEHSSQSKYKYNG